MMKRIVQAVLHRDPNDAIAMLKKTSLAIGMGMEGIGLHVMVIIVSKLIVVRLWLNDVMHYVLETSTWCRVETMETQAN